jgi:hypothetical protein
MEPREERKPKPWTCPSCSHPIGQVMFGQLFMSGDMTVNTDGPNLVIKCPNCGGRKIWFASDRLSQLISEIAEQVARRIGN